MRWCPGRPAGDFPCGLAARTERGQPLTNKEITLGVQSSATRPDGLMSAPIYSRFRHDIMGGRECGLSCSSRATFPPVCLAETCRSIVFFFKDETPCFLFFKMMMILWWTAWECGVCKLTFRGCFHIPKQSLWKLLKSLHKMIYVNKL